MQIKLPYYDYSLKVSKNDKIAIEELVEKSIADFKAQKSEIEALMLECVSNISNSTSVSSELSEQGALKRLIGGITGKNNRLRNALYRSTANTQYAQQQIIVKLIEQNASVIDFVAAIQKEAHTITLSVRQEQLDTNERLKQACLHLINHRNSIITLTGENERLSKELDNVVFACSKCKAFVDRKARVCHCCGHVINNIEPSLSTEEGAERFLNDLTMLSFAIQETQDMKKMISKSKLDWYQRKSRKIRYYVDRAVFPVDIRKKIMASCAEFEQTLETLHIEIAIAGTVKAGKSSLINALLDTEFAMVDATPETSVLAKYRTTRDENYLKVRFYSDTLWRKVWRQAERSPIYMDEYRELEAEAERSKWVGRSDYFVSGLDISDLQAELIKFTSSKSPVHFFVREVEVGIQSDLFPNDVYLVDTPGLDDAVEIRSNVTREYLDNADAVLACIKEKDIHEASEAKFINRVMGNRSEWKTLFVIATQKDLDKPSDYEKNRTYFVNKVLDPMFNTAQEGSSTQVKRYHAERQFFGISAKMYTDSLLYERGVLNEEDYDEYVSILRKAGFRDEAAFPERLDEIKKASGIPFLKENLENRLFRSTRSILHAKMDEALQDFLKQIHNIVEEEKAICEDRIELLNSNNAKLAEMRESLIRAGEMVSEIEGHMKHLEQKSGGVS